MRTRVRTALLAGCSIAFALPGFAQQQVVIYRCTDAAGQVTVQNNDPCPKGAREQRRVIEAPPTLPAFAPPESPELYVPPVRVVKRPVAAGAAPSPPQPPPALFQCATWDQLHYFTEEAKPQQHCAPLQVVGLDGVSRSQASACEMVDDQCEAVPAENLCHAWKQQVDEAEFRWRFAGAKDDDDRRREYEKLATVLANSNCNP